MLIRPLMSIDIASYAALMRLGLEENAESFRISAQDAGEPLIPFESVRPDAFTLGALEKDNDLVGTVSFERETRVKLRHKGLIYRMYVRADAAGRGIGRQLIQATVVRASQIHGLEQLNLTVVATNARAKHLYASEGFVSFALEQRGLKMGADYVDEEQMVLRLGK